MKIYVNQLGYLPDSSKVAVFAMPQEAASAGSVLSDNAQLYKTDGTCVFEKAPVAFGPDTASGDYIRHLDFSECTEPGTYYIKWNNETSYPFTVGDGLYGNLNVLLARALYFQRCGMELTEPYAGKFARKACHTAPSVLWNEYQKNLAGELSESEMKRFDIRGGWHDAGDYGRYTTAAACALAHILYAYRFFPDAFKQSLNIPESGNGIPDILNECRYELDWMLQMQAEDGSVYHKHTTKNHAGFVMPCEDADRLFLFPPSSMAAASFVATMALASRIYRRYDAVFADRALAAAKKSYAWLEAHPEFLFERIPDCHTGEYGDFSDKDERMWAAMELFRCTGDTAYLEKARTYFDEHPNPVYYGWADISGFAGWALLEDELMKAPVSAETAPLSTKEQSFRTAYKELLQKEANRLLGIIEESGYGVALGSKEYPWGSNLTVLNRAMLLGTTYLLEKNPAYYTGVVRQMDYLLGVNATDYSYVTGVGFHAFCNPHNRITVADGIEETIPGYVSGGANGHPGDELAKKLIAPGTPPMKCFADRWECYSLNEITIYWNSPAIFAASFLDSVKPVTDK
ncbi:MAG: glycoside hydrolase family 9 protein [Lachnospiraceae bacterium]|nr:glycoside hydrolase family 9 protein [Lachnospiraceae bacterium]